MRILVVGGSGRIGRAVCRRLVARHDVAVLDLREPGVEGVTWIRGDGRRLEDCRRAAAGREWVFVKTAHLGGLPSFDAPLEYHDTNVRIALNILSVTAESGVRSVVFDSSETVFGPDDPSPHREDRLPHPRSIYGATKLLVECYLRTYARDRKLRWIALRYPRVASAEGDNMITRAVATIRRGGPCEIARDNRSTLDLVHVDDIVEVHERLLGSDVANEVLHVGPGRGAPVRRILEWCIEQMGGGCALRVTDPPAIGGFAERDLYHRRMVLHCRRLPERLGFLPRSMEAIVRDVCAELREGPARGSQPQM